MATHSSTLAWKTPWTEEPCRLQSMGSQRVGHDWATSLSLSFSLVISQKKMFYSPLRNSSSEEQLSFLFVWFHFREKWWLLQTIRTRGDVSHPRVSPWTWIHFTSAFIKSMLCMSSLGYPAPWLKELPFLHTWLPGISFLPKTGKTQTPVFQSLTLRVVTSCTYVAFSTWHVWAHLIFPSVIWCRFYYYVTFYRYENWNTWYWITCPESVSNW